MRKAVFAIVLVVLLTACLPQTPAPQPGPVVETDIPVETRLETAIAQTLAALPTNTSTIPVNTPTPTFTAQVTATGTETATPLVEPTLTPTTNTLGVATSTSALAINLLGSTTATLTPGVLTYGTLPPAIPFSKITLANRAKTQAYISLQVVSAEGGLSIMEYPVRGKIEIKAPVGNYLFVAWVGGRKMVGEFRLHHEEDLNIFLYRDRVVVE